MQRVLRRVRVPELNTESKKEFNWKRYFANNWFLYLMLVPVLLYFIIFNYAPMYGVLIAWKRYIPSQGILGSPWVGWTHFKSFFDSFYFFRILRNTFLISFYDLLWGFPAPIIFALILNETKSKIFKSTVQTISYLPHFISTVIVCGILVDFLSVDGSISTLLNVVFGIERQEWLNNPGAFRPIFVASGIWQGLGWNAIIYLAALSNVDPELYQASSIDGCGILRRMWHVTIPGIMPTIVILFILRMGSMLSVGADKVILLYNPITYETGDVISSFVYRRGLIDNNFSYSTAVGLFNSAINLLFLNIANFISKRVGETSLW